MLWPERRLCYDLTRPDLGWAGTWVFLRSAGQLLPASPFDL